MELEKKISLYTALYMQFLMARTGLRKAHVKVQLRELEKEIWNE